jgi:hypothetical protein
MGGCVIQVNPAASRRLWLLWVLVFLAFPIGGWLANTIAGPTSSVVPAALAGLIVGAILGVGQWFLLKGQIPVSLNWVLATSLGAALGMAIGIGLLGSEMSGSGLLWRAGITGLTIGVAQWLVLRPVLPRSAVWVVVVVAGWVTAWLITRSAGIDFGPKWPVFGASGALAFQALAGLALYFLLRSSRPNRLA